MRFVPTRIHGMIDYLTGLLLMAAPWLLGFADGGAAQWVPVLLGLGTLVVSFCTDYELAAARLIPMPVHLGIDFASGLLLAVSPWLFGFAGLVWVPHLVVGLFEIVASLITQTAPAPIGHRTDAGAGA